MTLVESFKELRTYKQELEAVKQVVQINLVRALKTLEEVESELDENVGAFWMKDLPLNKTIRDYRQAVGELLTVYTQLENTYNTYFKKLFNAMAAFDERNIVNDLTAAFDADMTRAHERISLLETEKNELQGAFELVYQELQKYMELDRKRDPKSYENTLVKAAKKIADKQAAKMKKDKEEIALRAEKAAKRKREVLGEHGEKSYVKKVMEQNDADDEGDDENDDDEEFEDS